MPSLTTKWSLAAAETPCLLAPAEALETVAGE